MLRYGVYWKNEKKTDPLAAAALKQINVMIHEFMIWLLQENHSKRMGYLNDNDASTYQSMLSKIKMRPIQNMTT